MATFGLLVQSSSRWNSVAPGKTDLWKKMTVFCINQWEPFLSYLSQTGRTGALSEMPYCFPPWNPLYLGWDSTDWGWEVKIGLLVMSLNSKGWAWQWLCLPWPKSYIIFIRWFILFSESTAWGSLAPRGHTCNYLFFAISFHFPPQINWTNSFWKTTDELEIPLSSSQCNCTGSASSLALTPYSCNKWLPSSHQADLSISGSWLHIESPREFKELVPTTHPHQYNLNSWVLEFTHESFLKLQWFQLWELIV